MGVLSKGTTFADGTQVTSTKLNNLVDDAVFTASAVDDSTTQLSSGKIVVKTVGTGQLATNAVTTAKITDANVTEAKLAADSVSTAKIQDDAVTNAKIADNAIQQAQMADGSVGTAEIIDANVTAVKLDGAQTGSAPIYGIRAWAKLNPYVGASRTGAYKTGTYSRTLTDTTVNIAAHGLKVNDAIRLDFTSGSGTDGLYIVTSVPSANQFIVNHNGSATSGNVTAQFVAIQASGNISSATWYDSGDKGMVLNFTLPMPDTDYAILATGQLYPGAWLSTLGENTLGTTQLNTEYQAHVYMSQGSLFCSVAIVG